MSISGSCLKPEMVSSSKYTSRYTEISNDKESCPNNDVKPVEAGRHEECPTEY